MRESGTRAMVGHYVDRIRMIACKRGSNTFSQSGRVLSLPYCWKWAAIALLPTDLSVGFPWTAQRHLDVDSDVLVALDDLAPALELAKLHLAHLDEQR